MTMILCECFAYISADGLVLTDSDFDTPEVAWQVGLGWPAQDEIEAAKKRGAKVVKVRIVQVET